MEGSGAENAGGDLKSITMKLSEAKARGTSIWYEQLPHSFAPAECFINVN
jgi:hypothetical protein